MDAGDVVFPWQYWLERELFRWRTKLGVDVRAVPARVNPKPTVFGKVYDDQAV